MNNIGDGNEMVDTPRTDAEANGGNSMGVLMGNGLRDALVQSDFARQLERELQETHGRVRLLIAERDSARQQASQNWKLRDEFAALLGTDDVEEAVCRLKRWKALREAVVKESQTTDHSGGSNKMVELEALNRELVRMARQISTQTK
jgi:hypothetical protein